MTIYSLDVKVKIVQLCPTLLYSPWSYPGQNIGAGSISLPQGIFPTQGSSPGLLHCRQILYQLSHKGSPRILKRVAYPFSSRNWTRVSCIAGRFFTNWAMREAYSLGVLFPNSEPVHCSMSISNPHTGLTHIQISHKIGKVVLYTHLFENFPTFVVTHIAKGFSLVSEAEVDAFLEFSCFFYNLIDVNNLISGSSAFSKYSCYIWKFLVLVLLKASLKNFEPNLACM